MTMLFLNVPIDCTKPDTGISFTNLLCCETLNGHIYKEINYYIVHFKRDYIFAIVKPSKRWVCINAIY